MEITKRNSLGRIVRGSGLKHGLSDDPIYDCWIAMWARCTKPHHPAYKHYGKRGIGVDDRWKSFEAFFEDMGDRPSSSHSLDRIDNDGDYTKENCRWLTIQEQQKNKRNSNETVGVRFEADRKRWRADITNKGRKLFLGRYKVKEAAIEARLNAEKSFGYAI